VVGPELTAFGRQMVATRTNSGYRVDLDPRWNCPTVTHGGTATAVAAAAMARELDVPEQRLRTISAFFASPVGPGPAELGVTVLRRGRSVSHVTAALRDVGAAAGLTAIAGFGVDRPSFEFTDVTMPTVPSPAAAPSTRNRIDDVPPEHRNPYWQPGGAEVRWALGSTSAEDWRPTSTVAAWYRYDEPPFGVDGVLDPLAVVALCDVMPMAVSERMGWHRDVPRSVVVNIDLTVHLVADARSEWILGVNRAHAVGSGYASVQHELWDEGGTLVAFATAVLVQSFPQGVPSTDRLRPPR
jgi:acyl-CoA thioesterase